MLAGIDFAVTEWKDRVWLRRMGRRREAVGERILSVVAT